MAICDICYFAGNGRIAVSKDNPCPKCGNHSTDLPDDYEVCCVCMYDHQYESEEAAKEHALIELAKTDNMFLSW
jgi:hypothetical protein